MGNERELIRRCRREGTPLIEGQKAIFLWEGDAPAWLIGDFNDWETGEASELQPAGDNLWFFELSLPDDAYMEYVYLDKNGQRQPDPFNPRRVSNGMGKVNQFFYMPKGKPTPWILRNWGGSHGKVTPVTVECGGYLAGGRRTVHFYQPSVDEPVPLLLAWDGGDYLRRAKLAALVENLAHAGRIRPLALAMVENGGPARTLEYSCNDATIGFLLDCLLPKAYEVLNLLDVDEFPGSFGVLGSSLGGLMALYTGLRLPHLFGRVLAQSGAYELSGFEFITSLMVEHGPRVPLKIWMDAGRFEYLLEASRGMQAKLRASDYDVQYHEYSGGHNYTAWRDDLPAGLESLFG